MRVIQHNLKISERTNNLWSVILYCISYKFLHLSLLPPINTDGLLALLAHTENRQVTMHWVYTLGCLTHCKTRQVEILCLGSARQCLSFSWNPHSRGWDLSTENGKDHSTFVSLSPRLGPSLLYSRFSYSKQIALEHELWTCTKREALDPYTFVTCLTWVEPPIKGACPNH